MASFSRMQKINQQIMRKVSVLLQTECSDPRITGFISIKSVVTSPDLSLTKIFFTVLNEDNLDEINAGLRKAAGFVRTKLSQELTLKRVPKITFVHDARYQKGDAVRNIIDKMYPEEIYVESEEA